MDTSSRGYADVREEVTGIGCVRTGVFRVII